jgi:hypothetical protein
LEQKHNNHGSRMWSNRFAPLANPYITPGKSLKANGQGMMEMESVTKRVAVEEAKAKAEAEGKEEEEEAEEAEEVIETDEEEEEERVVVLMEGEDTVSPLSSKQSNEGGRGKGKQQEGWKPAGRKEKRDLTTEAKSKANTVGIKMVRIGKTGNTIWSPKDVSHFFELLRKIDPNAIVMNARKETTSAMTTKEVEKMGYIDYRGYLDMRNDSWGAPTENKTKTVWMCHVATDILTPTLQQLRDDKQVQEYLRQGDVIMQYTKLHESNSKVVFHFANKDPKYTNRNDLEKRMQHHLNQFSNKVIPIHVLNMAVSGKNFQTRMCTAVVGGKDVRRVESILKAHPFYELEIIPFAWKFQDSTGYTRRLKEHEGVLKICKAIKLEEMNVNDELDDFKTLMEADTQTYKFVVDIFPANHAERTGVTYVQYISEHKEAVVGLIQDVIRMIKDKRVEQEEGIIVPFPDGPKMTNNNRSATPSIQTTNTNKTSTLIPSSKYGGLLDPNQKVQTSKQVPWAISVNTRSFREAVVGRQTSQDSDSETETSRSGITSGYKSARETELEQDNQRLHKQIEDKEEQFKLTLQHVQEGFDRQRIRDREYQEQQSKMHKQEMKALQAEHKQAMAKITAENKEQIESFKAIILEMASQIDKANIPSTTKADSGSTPKRPKKRSISTTPLRHEPEEGNTTDNSAPMAEIMTDAEPFTLEEGVGD